MLTLAEASSYFDRTEVRDPDTNALLFYGQVDPFDDSKRDSGGAYRRVLSVAPGTPIPAKGVVRIFGRVWVVGLLEVDGLQDPHRDKYVLQTAPVKHSISRLSGFLTAAVASSQWGSSEWVKDAKEVDASSKHAQMFYIFFPSSADVREHDVVWWGLSSYLTLSVHPQASGFLVATCVKLEHQVVDATLNTRVYDPEEGAFASSTPTTVKALRVRWQSLFLYGSEADAKYRPGDCSIVLPAGTVVATKDTITLAGTTWSVSAVEEISGAVVVHARP